MAKKTGILTINGKPTNVYRNYQQNYTQTCCKIKEKIHFIERYDVDDGNE